MEVLPYVQILDVPVPQLGGELMEFMQKHDTVLSEQVIEVPKISLDKVPRHRMVDLAHPPEMAEQLVEVPTIISYSTLQTIEQTMDIPVPRVRGGGGGGLQGQGTSAAGVEQIVEFPVLQRRRKRTGGFQGFFPGQNSTADVEQNVDIPARGGLHGFLPGQGFFLIESISWRRR